jgi:hypothetical protein
MRRFNSQPDEGNLTGPAVEPTEKDVPINLISIYPEGGSISHTSMSGDDLRLPARSPKFAQLYPAGRYL